MTRTAEVARLFVTLEAETKGLQQGLDSAERSLGRTAKFIQDNPVAALAGLGSAAIAAGVFVTKMAAEVDEGVKRIGANIPNATKRLDELKQAARDLSVEFGVSQSKVVDVMTDLARRGIDSVEGLLAASRAAVVAQKATGEDFGAIVAALDASLDVFGLAATDSEKVLARLFQTAQGKTSISELGEVIERLRPIVEQSGVSFDTLTAAAAELISHGKTTKQVIAELTDTINKQGVPAVEELAKQSNLSGDGLKEMRAQAEVMNNTAGALADQLKAKFNASLIELGERLLPLAIKGMQALNLVFDQFAGAKAKLGFGEAADIISESVVGKSVQELTRLKTGFEQVVSSGRASGDELKKVQAAIAAITAELQRQQPAAVANKNTLADIVVTASQLSEAQRRAVQSSNELDASQKKVILTAQKLTDDQLKLVDKAVKETTKKATEGAKASADALNEIRKATLESATALLTTQHAEFIKLEEAFNEKKKKLYGDDLKTAEALFDEQKHNILFKWAGFTEDLENHPLTLKQTEHNVRALEPAFSDAVKAGEDFKTKIDKVALEAEAAATKHQLLIDRIKEMSLAFGDGVHAIGGILTSFGLLDEPAKQVIQGLEGISDAIGRIAGGDILGGAAGGLISLAGLVKGIFGDSPAAKQARETLLKNTQRIEELNKTTGDLVDAQSSGHAIAGTGSAITAFLGSLSGGKVPREINSNTFSGIREQLTGQLASVLREQGLGIGDLESVAKDLGINVLDAKGNLDLSQLASLLKAINVSDLGAPKTFKGRLSTLDTNLQAGITGKDQEFGALLNAIGGGNAIAGALSGVTDIAGAGRGDAIKNLQQVLSDLNAGKITDKNALGDLSRPEFVAAIVRLLGILQSDTAIGGFVIPGALGSASGGGAAVDFADSLDAAFGTDSPAVDYLAQIAANTAVFNPVSAPSAPASGGSAPGLGVNLTLNLTFNGSVDAASVTAAARLGALEALDAGLGTRTLQQRQVVGNAAILN